MKRPVAQAVEGFVDPDNPAHTRAWRLLQAGGNAFITGGAGVGKSHFIRALVDHMHHTEGKNVAMVAPTGMAALNVGGQTLHSFFGLPMHVLLPGEDLFKRKFIEGLFNRYLKLTGKKIGIIRALDMLVIDEASMLRADILDGVDYVCRHVRNVFNEPFGGIQVVMVGDPFQLPPVVDEDDARLLQGHYPSNYFFSARVWQELEPTIMTFEKVYRQQDQDFIRLLNQLRLGSISPADIDRLNRELLVNLPTQQAQEPGMLALFPYNNMVDRYNRQRLHQLPGLARTFTAQLAGKFPPDLYPIGTKYDKGVLHLKPLAQVLMRRNTKWAHGDSNLFVNGTIATLKAVLRQNPRGFDQRDLDDEATVMVASELVNNNEPSSNLYGQLNLIPMSLGELKADLLPSQDALVVQLPGDNGLHVALPRYKWENTVYEYVEEFDGRGIVVKKLVKPMVIGSFSQFPLQLAWAITIHKSQGQTYDRVLIDFTTELKGTGQAYVALSRCRTMEGIRLVNPLLPKFTRVDPTLLAWAAQNL